MGDFENHNDRTGPLPDFLIQPPGVDVVPIATPAGDKMWLVCDHALGRQVLTDRRFSRARAVTPEAPKVTDSQPVPSSIASMDGAEHHRLRKVVASAFTTGRVAAMTTAIENLTDGYLDAIEEAGPGADLIEGLAVPLPLSVLCTLLGIPAADTSQFRDWVEVLFDLSASHPTEKARRRLEIAGYMADLLDRRQREPGDDLLSVMIAAKDRGEMSMSELMTLGLALLMAGYETTTGQIGLSVLYLLREPGGWAGLRERPDRLGTVVDELLRVTPATPLSFPRVAVEPVRIGGVTVEVGEAVMVSLMHGNRDTAAFDDPDRLRPDGRTAAHLTFGHGVHRCVGAPLARLQLQIVLDRLSRRFPALSLADGCDSVIWKDGLGTRGLSRLSVCW